ncbi:hypothetical protein FOZ60_002749 [Perkinsus olseni]|uniref:Uncharacterized protein n=1 Tax=Perkinsus olseni TaxID=32597 RepID=A0A7J6NX75_PEROL|nr:hypothetical protein FOZ60_002749 [Perkinsus olseni]
MPTAPRRVVPESDTPKPLSSPRNHPISGVSIGKTFRLLLMMLILTASILYAFFNLGLLVAKDFIIEAYISRWRMELRSFSMGPPPAWLDDPPEDFLHLPPRMRAFGPALASFFTDGAAISEDGTLSFAAKVPLVDVCEGGYLCLHSLPSTEQIVAFDIYFEAEFTLFGHRSNTFEFVTKVDYDASMESSYRGKHELSPRGEMMARNCWEAYHLGASTRRVPNPGEVIALRANYRSSSHFILL